MRFQTRTQAAKLAGPPRLLAAVLLSGLVALAAGCGQEAGQGGATGGSNGASTQQGSTEQGSTGGGTGIAAGEWPVTDVAADVAPSVVQVNVQGSGSAASGTQESRGQGSGVIYRENGYIITNNHVVAGADQVEISLADGTTEPARVVGTDEYTDLAVVKVDRQGLPAAEFAESSGLVPGQLAVAIGNPSGFESTVTSGVISGLGREIPSRFTGGPQPALVDLIQTDAAISPGSSGGALANVSGQVVGINAAYLPPSRTGAVNIGFAIPSDTATSVADQLIEDGEAVQPYLGLSLADLTPQVAERFSIEAEQGALVTGRDPDGPLAGSDISQGSVITAIGSKQVESAAGLISALREYQPGDEVTLTVLNNSDRQEITVELGERGQQG